MTPEQTQAFRHSILVVDDEASVRDALAKLLSRAGYDVALAANGNEAVHQLKLQRVNLVLLDLNFPSESGWDIFQSLTSIHSSLRAIVITGQPDMVPLSMAARVASILAKPVDVPQLLESIQSLLRGPTETASGPSAIAQTMPEKTAPGSSPQISVKTLVETKKATLLDRDGGVNSDRVAGKNAHCKVLPNKGRNSNTVFGRVVCCFKFVA